MNADVEIFAQDGTMNEIYDYERTFHNDVETFVVWVVPRNSGENWSTCSGLRETLFYGSRSIFSRLQVTYKVKRRLTLTFRNHKYKMTRKIQGDQLPNIARGELPGVPGPPPISANQSQQTSGSRVELSRRDVSNSTT